jgi:hypothetical protein
MKVDFEIPKARSSNESTGHIVADFVVHVDVDACVLMCVVRVAKAPGHAMKVDAV